MQDAFYKPRQLKDEVFCVIYAREQMFKPVLIRGSVVNFVRFSDVSTYYHIQPLEMLGSFEPTLTLRYINATTKRCKDITFSFDASNVRLNWAQQFAVENPDYLLDCQHWSVFGDLKSAVESIHNLNNSAILKIASEMQALTAQNDELYKLITNNGI
ncbi:hypothetical protein MA9V1_018 [Chryseobacterium phage MA9V-1]|nr:hypothetical protein MA9V1_018 [Chryseobacterium phage MA9V-1]